MKFLQENASKNASNALKKSPVFSGIPMVKATPKKFPENFEVWFRTKGSKISWIVKSRKVIELQLLNY